MRRARFFVARVVAVVDGAVQGMKEARASQLPRAALDATVVATAYALAFLGAVGDEVRRQVRRWRRIPGHNARRARARRAA